MSDGISEGEVKEQLKEVNFPNMGKDIVSLGFVKDISTEGESVSVLVATPTKSKKHLEQLEQDIEQTIDQNSGVRAVEVEFEQTGSNERKQKQNSVQPEPVEGVDEVIAAASGKGGVGKSTVAVNLAGSLSRQGYEVGFADMDLYGPSAPTVFGLDGKPEVTADEQIIPLDFKGIQVISIGFVLPGDQPTIWRGPMVSNGVEQLLGDVRWDELDYLILDLPPGTGDTQITLCQKIEMTGAVLVTTPQQIAVADVRRAERMFSKMGVDTLGVVENMSSYICPECGAERSIFGSGGGKKLADELSVPFLGGIPLSEDLQQATDSGNPIVFSAPDSEATGCFDSIASTIIEKPE